MNLGGPPNPRLELCRRLGLRNEAEAYSLVAAAAKEGPANLLKRGLKYTALLDLGYTVANLRRLGLGDETLAALGFPGVKPPPKPETAPAPPPATAGDATEAQVLCALVASGATAPAIKQQGFNIHHLKKAGISATEIARCGFQLMELVQAFSCGELKRAGFTARDLRSHFHGSELKSGGVQASEMRSAGFGIRELLNFGYNENQVRTAGYSVVELQREGLSKQTVDRTKSMY